MTEQRESYARRIYRFASGQWARKLGLNDYGFLLAQKDLDEFIKNISVPVKNLYGKDYRK